MATISVLRSDSLEQFRQKVNQLSTLVGDPDISPSGSIAELLTSIQSDINSLVLPFYNSSGAIKDIPLKII